MDNLDTVIQRGVACAPNHTPADGLPYRPTHSHAVQSSRDLKLVGCGPRGVIPDYVPFYFGRLSVMLLNLKTGRVAGYDEGQEPIIYLVSTAQAVDAGSLGYVFTDGHGLAAFTSWFDDLSQLGAVDWGLVNERYWSDTRDDNDRQRRKQAEFLVHQGLPWRLISEIAVFDAVRARQVAQILQALPERLRPPIAVRRDWYYV